MIMEYEDKDREEREIYGGWGSEKAWRFSMSSMKKDGRRDREFKRKREENPIVLVFFQ